MAVWEAKKQARSGGLVEGVIRQVVSQLVYAIVGEVQLPVRIPVVPHSVAYAWKQHRQSYDNALFRNAQHCGIRLERGHHLYHT